MAKNNNSPSGDRVVDHCPVDGCKKTADRLHFCSEHFIWYKEGLVNKKGKRPSDFDKKYQHFLRKKSA